MNIHARWNCILESGNEPALQRDGQSEAVARIETIGNISHIIPFQPTVIPFAILCGKMGRYGFTKPTRIDSMEPCPPI